MRRFVLPIILALSLVSPSLATIFIASPQPIVIQQPAGRWMLCQRPCPLGNFLFGPIWVFIPNQAPAAPGQNPIPQNSGIQALSPLK